jgi:hypothetical protein
MVCVNVNKQAFLDLLSEYDDYLDNLNFEFSDGRLRLFSTLYEDHIITYPFKDYEAVYDDGVYSLFCLYDRNQILKLADYIENIPDDYDDFKILFSNRSFIVSYDAPDYVLIDTLHFKD